VTLKIIKSYKLECTSQASPPPAMLLNSNRVLAFRTRLELRSIASGGLAWLGVYEMYRQTLNPTKRCVLQPNKTADAFIVTL